MSTAEAFQIPLAVAESYEATFVPRMFSEWAPHVLDAAHVGPGTSLLDVARGTGIVARTAVDRVGDDGTIIGVDLNGAMLTVARRVAPDVDWRQGDVADLPFEDGTFDAVTCQMAMMFFPDRDRAVAEMIRVTRPGGWIGLAVPASLDAQPAYRPFAERTYARIRSDVGEALAHYTTPDGSFEIPFVGHVVGAQVPSAS